MKRDKCISCKYYEPFFNSCNLYQEEVYLGEGDFDVMPVSIRNCANDTNCYFKESARAKEENEKLKSENFTFEELIKIQEKLIDKYKQALNEIEVNILKYQELTFDKPRTMQENDCIYNILSIINQVKEK